MSNEEQYNIINENRSNKIGFGYAPAHITCIFEIHNTDPDPLKCGSRGLGFCINKGVSTYVIIKKKIRSKIDVFFNGVNITGETTKTTIEELIGKTKAQIQVFSFSELPLSQGFGLSGAGALSTAIALNSALKLELDYGKLVNSAHKAEIINKSGLGDVIAQANGGVVFRMREGGYNFSKIRKINFVPQNSEVVISILGKTLETSKIISNKLKIQKINSIGKKSLDRFNRSLSMKELSISIKDLTRQSFKFATETGLIDKHVLMVIDKIHDKGLGYSSMVMLGNAIFSIGDTDKIKKLCSVFGQTMHCKIEPGQAPINLKLG